MDIKYRVPRHRRKFPHSDPLLVLGIALAQRPGAALFREQRPFLVVLAGVRRRVPVVVLFEAARHGVSRDVDLVLRHLARENGIIEAIFEPSLVPTGV